jgi:hypothetical protein
MDELLTGQYGYTRISYHGLDKELAEYKDNSPVNTGLNHQILSHTEPFLK